MSEGAFSSLCAELLGRGESIRFRASGSSMEPAIKDGDLLTVEPRPAGSVSKGEIVFYESAGRLTAHRVLRRDRESRSFICRGDSWFCEPEIVPESLILGVATAVGESGAKPRPRSGMSVLRRSIRRLVLLFARKLYPTIYGYSRRTHASIRLGVGSWPGLAKGERKS